MCVVYLDIVYVTIYILHTPI